MHERLCIYCQKLKVWEFSGDRLKDGSKIYLDENGMRWAGRRCPECEKVRVQTAIRCDPFKRDLIIKRLEADGYRILSRTLPLRVEKGGQEFTVGIRHATTDGGRVLMDKAGESKQQAQLVAVVFESIRIIAPHQLEGLV